MLEIIALVAIASLVYFLVRYIIAYLRKKPQRSYLMGFAASLTVLSLCTAFLPSKQEDVLAMNKQAAVQLSNRMGSPFSIAYPQDWEEIPFATTDMKMAAPKEAQSVYLAVSTVLGEGERIAQTDEKQLKLQVDASLSCEETQVERLEHVTISGAEAVRAVYVTADEDAPEKKTLTYYTLVRDGQNAQLFLCDCPVELREQYEPIFQRMANSIYLLEPQALAENTAAQRGMPLIGTDEDLRWAEVVKKNPPILLTVEVKEGDARELLTIEKQADILAYVEALREVRVDMSASVRLQNMELTSTTYTFTMPDESKRAFTFFADPDGALWRNGADIGHPATGLEALEALNNGVR